MSRAPELQTTALHEMLTTKEQAFELHQGLVEELSTYREKISDLALKAKTAKATAVQFSPQIAEQLAEQVTKEIEQAVAELQRRLTLGFRGWSDDSSTQELNYSKE